MKTSAEYFGLAVGP